MKEGGEEYTRKVRLGHTGRGDVEQIQHRGSNAEVENRDGFHHRTKVAIE